MDSQKKGTKNKQNPCAKLKTILVNPYITKIPSLDETEVQQLRDLIIAATDARAKEARIIATQKRIHLGLESSIRAINQKQFSLVILSQSIKPRFLIGIIARNAEINSESAPVYVQAKLESITEDLFGVKALALVLPLDLKPLGSKLEEWLEIHKRRKKSSEVEANVASRQLKRKRKELIEPVNIESLKPHVAKPLLPRGKEAIVERVKAETVKEWSGDFISLSNDVPNSHKDKLNLSEDRASLLGTLEKLARSAMNAEDHKTIQSSTHTAAIESEPRNEHDLKESESECDDFLEDYHTTKVARININPARSDKKLKKKSKAKIKKKTMAN